MFRMSEGLSSLLDSAVKTAVYRLANAEIPAQPINSNVNR